jgi:hypothetical protein
LPEPPVFDGPACNPDEPICEPDDTGILEIRTPEHVKPAQPSEEPWFSTATPGKGPPAE